MLRLIINNMKLLARKSIEKVAVGSEKTTKNLMLTKNIDRRAICQHSMDFEEFKVLALGDYLSSLKPLSEREDLNLRPLDPQSSALPDCATSRIINY